MRREHAKPKTLSNGVVVPPGLQVSELTLRQHRELLADKKVRMNEAMARSAGYSDEEIRQEFGEIDR